MNRLTSQERGRHSRRAGTLPTEQLIYPLAEVEAIIAARLADAEARAEAAEATVQRVTAVVLARPICYGCFAPDHPCGDPACDLERAIREALRGDQ